jgi:hypothetical protein
VRGENGEGVYAGVRAQGLTGGVRVKPLWGFLRASLGIATDLFAVLLACRLSTLLTILGFVFFVLVGQGREF